MKKKIENSVKKHKKLVKSMGSKLRELEDRPPSEVRQLRKKKGTVRMK